MAGGEAEMSTRGLSRIVLTLTIPPVRNLGVDGTEALSSLYAASGWAKSCGIRGVLSHLTRIPEKTGANQVKGRDLLRVALTLDAAGHR